MGNGLSTIGLLLLSNVFMTFAWYGHLKFGKGLALPLVVLVSWAIALFEYCFQVPGNRFGHVSYGGPFETAHLKTIQEVITLLVFSVFSVVVLRERLRWNYIVGFSLMIAAVFFVFLNFGKTD